MAVSTIDRIRLVELRNTVPYTVLELMDGTYFNCEYQKFQTNRPTKTRSTISGSRRFDGDKIAFEKMGNASLNATWYVRGTDGTLDGAHAAIERFGQQFETVSTQGRYLEVRFAGTSKSVYYELRGTPDWALTNYDPRQAVAVPVLELTATIPVAPLAYGAPMDVQDDFLTDTIAAGDWAREIGTNAFVWQGDSYAPSGLGSRITYRHQRGYAYRDGTEVRLTVQTGASVTSGRWGVFFCANQDGSDTRLSLELDAAAGQYGLFIYVGGTRTLLTAVATTVTANTVYYLRMLREADKIRYLVQSDTIIPTFAIDDYSLTFWHTPYALPAVVNYLQFQEGDCGIDVSPVSTGERYSGFAIRPYSFYSVGMPEVHRVCGVPGTAPATLDVEVTTADAGAIGQPPIWASVFWSERPLPFNLLNNGDFENVPGSLGDGWQHAALTNYITNAATSHTRDGSVSRYGAASLQIVTPASTGSGASCTIYRRLKADRVYAALCWARSASQTTLASIRVGGTGLLGSTIGTAKALSPTWQLYSCTFVNTSGFADTDQIITAFVTQAATATTMNVDGFCVLEVPTITVYGALGSTATTMNVYSTPGDVPNLRPDGTLNGSFLAMIDQEIVRVTAIAPNSSAGTPRGDVWTIERGAEHTAAASHAADSYVVLLPASRPQLEGKGAHPPFGIIEGESYDPTISAPGASTIAIATGTQLRTQAAAQVTWASGTAPALYYHVDPSLIVADDFTSGEVDVEVFARVFVSTVGVTTIATFAEPTERFNGLVLAGRRRYTREYGALFKTLVAPSTASEYRIVRLGTIPMIVDRQNPQRWRIRLTVVSTAANNLFIDYLMLAPVRNRACLPTGKADDGGATYPSFFPFDPNWGTGSALTKILRSDGSAAIRNPIPSTGRYNSLPPAYPDHGLGRQMMLSPGDNDLVVKISDTVPDDPTVNNASDMSGGGSASWAGTVRAIVWPRYYVGRGGA